MLAVVEDKQRGLGTKMIACRSQAIGALGRYAETLNQGVSSAAFGINDFCVEARASKVFSTDLETKSL